jgi:hypothetical protein
MPENLKKDILFAKCLFDLFAPDLDGKLMQDFEQIIAKFNYDEILSKI